MFVCICECFFRDGEDGMVVCVSVSLHNPQVLAYVTIPRRYTNAMLIWISQLHLKMPLKIPFLAHVYSGILASTVSSFLPVVNYYLAFLHVDACVHFLHAYTSAAVNYGNSSAACGAMAASRARRQGSFTGRPVCRYAAAIQRVYTFTL